MEIWETYSEDSSFGDVIFEDATGILPSVVYFDLVGKVGDLASLDVRKSLRSFVRNIMLPGYKQKFSSAEIIHFEEMTLDQTSCLYTMILMPWGSTMIDLVNKKRYDALSGFLTIMHGNVIYHL